MKKEIIIIVGLPGSGKSHLIKDRFSEKERFVVFDDVQGGAVLDCPNFCFSRHYPRIVTEMILDHKSIVISDIGFCRRTSFLEVKSILTWWISEFKLNYEIHAILFENNPETCKSNIERLNGNNNASRLRMINKFTIEYDPQIMRNTNDEIAFVYKGQ